MIFASINWQTNFWFGFTVDEEKVCFFFGFEFVSFQLKADKRKQFMSNCFADECGAGTEHIQLNQ